LDPQDKHFKRSGILAENRDAVLDCAAFCLKFGFVLSLHGSAFYQYTYKLHTILEQCQICRLHNAAVVGHESCRLQGD
jgi:hypothetical protein